MKTILTAAAAVLTAVLLVGLFAGVEAATALLAVGGLGMGFAVKDALLKRTHALPNAAATTQSATGIDLGHGSFGDFVADCEALVTAPALTVGEAANGDTVTYSLEHDTDSAFGGAATIPGCGSVIVQTGAGGVGAAAATAQVRLPVDVKRYVRLKTVKTGTGNATTKSATLEIVT